MKLLLRHNFMNDDRRDRDLINQIFPYYFFLLPSRKIKNTYLLISILLIERIDVNIT